MPVQTAPSLVYASSSTFAPDFGSDSMKCASKSTISPQRLDDRSFFIPSLNSAPGHSVPFDHHEIISSTRRTSESTDSSPTTTSSTFDTTSIADMSPSSSPESPSALQLPYLKSTRIAEITERLAMFPDALISASNPVPATSRPVSPGRRARNLKNLSLKVPGQISRPAISTASAVEVKSQNYSAPSSPVLRPPPKTGRRKPANLTIRTPASDQITFARNIAGIIPPTPSVPQLPQRSLRRFDSSPSLSVFSPAAGPTNGMQLPRPTTEDGIPQMPGSWQDSPPLVQPQPEPKTSLQQVTEEEDYHLDSRESSKRAEKSYPDGPIKIYDSGVYLYLEPTKDEARNFDVVINVAKEVLNPFAKDKDPKPDTVVSSLRRPISLAKRLSMAEPMTAISEESFHSAFESLPSSESCSPTTPKTEKENFSKTPEYIHVPWDHNSEILDDLATLCQLVDDRINQGKTVLIHCQLGASRSASLVIAYGLYKNRELDFNDMYGIVKSKSQWVGPNMSLIYQLTDFRSRVQRDEPIKGPNPDWFETSNNISRPVESEQPSQNASETGSVFPIEKIKHTPPPVLPEMIFSPVQNIFRTPFAKAFPPSHQSSHNSKARAPLPRPLPLREKYSNLEPSTKPNRREPRKLAHVRYPTVHMDLVMQDVPSSPSILSPRAAPYMCSSLSRTLAGDLAGDAPSPALKFGQSIFDPRSPPQRQELLITRSIDEVL